MVPSIEGLESRALLNAGTVAADIATAVAGGGAMTQFPDPDDPYEILPPAVAPTQILYDDTPVDTGAVA